MGLHEFRYPVFHHIGCRRGVHHLLLLCNTVLTADSLYISNYWHDHNFHIHHHRYPSEDNQDRRFGKPVHGYLNAYFVRVSYYKYDRGHWKRLCEHS